MNMKFTKTLLSSLALVTLALTAFDPGAAAQAGPWEFEVGIYGWLPTINGELNYNIPGLGDDVTVDPGTLIDNLQFTAMGAFAVRYNKFSVFADMIYLSEAETTNEQLPIGGGVNLQSDFKLKSWIVNPGVAYEMIRDERGTTVALLIGARYFYTDTYLGLKADGPLATDTSVEAKNTLWNGIIGASGRIALGKHWFVPYHVDIGSGDSDLTWQGLAGVSYNFKWGGPVLAYRYIDFEQGSEGLVRSLSFGGFELGVGFRFH